VRTEAISELLNHLANVLTSINKIQKEIKEIVELIKDNLETKEVK